MKKVITLILAVMLVVMLAACSNWKSSVTDYSGDVSSNGGLAVVKGDYVYFINGHTSNDLDNTFGSVIRGGIVRVKTADLGKADAKVEMVVPKIVYTEYYGEGSGIFIFGDYVYYPTPCDKKNSKGGVRYDETEFRRTKLDGTDSSVILTVASLSTPYRFFAEGNDVYLTVYNTAKDADGNEGNYLLTYDVKGKEVGRSHAVASYDLGGANSAYAYYTRAIRNEELDTDESFNALCRYSYNGKEDVDLFNGMGGFGSGNGGIGTEGAEFEIVKVEEKTLYLLIKYVDDSIVESTVYYAIDYSDINAAGTDDAVKANVALLNDERVLDNGTGDASTILASTSVFVAPNCIIYFDTAKGIVKYDCNDRDKLNLGITYILDDDDLKTYAFSYYENGKMYFTDPNGYYYSLDLAGLIDLSTGETLATPTAKPVRLTYETTYNRGEWIEAEIVGDYMLYRKSGSPYYEYIFVADFKAFDKYLAENYDEIPEGDDYDKAVDKFIDENEVFDKAGFERRFAKRIAIMTEEDLDAVAVFMEDFE